MPELDFVTLDVFTKTRYEGNPLALVKIPKGQDVSTEQMQKIAREFNLSETIFVHEAEGGGKEWRVRIFLTDREIPFAGHPTIGAAVYALSTLSPSKTGRLIANAGPIDLSFSNDIATASIPHNFHLHTQYPITTQDVYHLQPSLQGTLENDETVKLLSPVKGMTFITVELPDLSTLSSITTAGIKPTTQLDSDWNESFVATYFWVQLKISLDSDGIAKSVLRTRMMESSFEDPATGSAACGLCCYLALQASKISKTHEFEITQAVEMGRKSDIGVKVTLTETRDAVQTVELSGSAVKVMEGKVNY